MRSHPQRHVLLSCIGGGSDPATREIAPPWSDGNSRQDAELQLAPGDTLILCTDGLSGLVEEATIQSICTIEKKQATELAAQLVEAALAAGGTDNVTVAVVRVTGTTGNQHLVNEVSLS
jgi:PPM family protein phosphatase